MLGTEISDISEIPIRCIFCQSCGSPSNKNRSWWRNKPKGFPVPKEAAEYSLLPSYDDKIKEGKVPRLCASCRWTIGDQISLIKEEGLARLLKIEKENRDGRKSFAYILDPQADLTKPNDNGLVELNYRYQNFITNIYTQIIRSSTLEDTMD